MQETLVNFDNWSLKCSRTEALPLLIVVKKKYFKKNIFKKIFHSYVFHLYFIHRERRATKNSTSTPAIPPPFGSWLEL